MKQRIYILLITLLTCVNVAWAKVQTVNGKTYNVVYMSSAGAGNKSGDDAANAVSGWANAYNKLSKTGGTYEDDWNYNIIVIVGSTNIQINTTESNTKDIPATITNMWPWEDEDGNSLVSGSGVSGGCKLTLNGSARACRIGAPTRFKNVCFTSNGSDCRFCLFLHHTMFDVGCVMNNMGTLSTDMGAMDKTTHKAPSFHMMLFSDEHDFTSGGNGAWNNPEPMNLTIRSGKFGRILCTRVAGTDWGKQTSKRYTIGKPDAPLMAKIEVDIESQTSDYNPTGYKDDIAFLCAGTTQGTVFVDMQMDIKRGQIATIVGGSQGNAIAVCSQNGIPTSTYCGRSTVNVIGENDSDVKIFRYYGGCLGRFTDKASGTCSAYFYGHSTINLVHGTIEQDIFASCGGLSGLRNPNNGAQHTSDQFIPYQGGSNQAYPFLGIDYSSYNASKNIVQITSVLKGSSPEVIDLADTKIITNMSGGVVKGNVYGGSYGYSSEMVLKGAPEGAGSLWGNTEVNISGGEIQGDVYGGGGGAKSYYNLATTDDDRAKFLTVATVYGNTNLTITGKPTIQGNIYGGGAGLASQAKGATDVIDVGGTETTKTDLPANEFTDIAKVYGNTNVTIDAADDWEYTGNIYGGGALGAVEGNTNVIIKGGKINGNVFAGGLGEDGHADKAKVTGSTLANIQGGTQGDEYAVYGGAQMALVDGNTAVILQGGTVGNAYGGGLGTNTMAANVTRDATVQLGSNDGTTASKVLGSIFGANNLNGTPEGHVLVHVLKTAPRGGQGAEEYDVAAVYGGGNEAAYVPTDGNDFAEVLIENCDNSIAYVYGGGNAAPVPATKVTIVGANAIDNAFAGGNGAGQSSDPSAPNYNPGADIGYLEYTHNDPEKEYGTGIATIEVKGGTIHHVYGGSNTLGYIKDHAVVNVNAAGTCTMDVAELYGGGKMAPGKAAQINITCTGEGKIDNVYGGAHMADLTGNIELNIRGGNIGNAFGGNNESGTINGAITVNVNWDTDVCGTNSLNNVYGAGNKADYAGSPAVNILNGTVSENVFGGGLEATVTGNPIVTVNGGTVSLGAYGGGALADVDGTTTVNIISGTVGNAYGGGLGQLADAVAGKEAIAATVTGNANVTVSGGTTTNVFGCNNLNGSPEGNVTVTIKEAANVTNVYGGGNQAAASVSPVVNINGGTSDKVYGGGYGAPAVLTGNTTINVAGGSITKDVYGGGALANITGSTAINVSGGTVAQDVYGGGALANVSANTSLNLTGGSIRNSYGGGLGSAEVAALIGGDATTTLNGSIVLGNVFGCNNFNGTPQGHVLVDVKNTAAKGTETSEHPYHVAGVYGGGNLAAYVPTNDTEKTEVLIENCDNSIENVFGGGNAAAVPETNVTVWGGQLGRVFAGGNGESAPANVTRDTHVMIHGGTIGEVYGGSNNSGDIGGTIYVDVAELKYLENDLCPVNVDDLYGGGNLAACNAGQINIGKCTSIDRVFGGAHNADVNGDITLAINDGHINSVFGGNNEGGDINGAITVNIDWVNDADASLNNVYGGGNLAPYTTPDGKVGPTVNLINGTISGSAFGGGLGKTAIVTGNPKVYLNGATVVNDIYGGGDAANVIGTANVQVDKGTVKDVYGGGNAADVTNTDVIINGGKVTMAFAGGHGDKIAEPQTEANVTGDAHLTIHGGTVAKAFAGSNSKGTITGSQLVTIVKDAHALAELHVAEVYGGGNQADGKAGTFDIGCTGSDSEGIGDLFGGAREANITGDVAFTIEGGKIDRIFGGNNVSGNVAGSIQVNIAEDKEKYDCGLNVGYVYGGGQDAAYTPTTPGAYPEVNIIGGNIAHDVFGGGLGATAIVTSNPVVNIKGGTIGNNVFGGGSLAETEGNPTVNVSGGTVTHDVYGGGALADVTGNTTGNTTVNLTGGAVGGAYGGALGSAEVAAKVNGDTYVHLDGSKVTETGIFGANNLNGTPTGHVKVHVTRTTPRDGQNAEDYDVPAVYGGGNLSAYEPSDETFAAGKGFAEVLIENCDNSINYVYGGGNAAPVPATKVTIYGANAINYAFAGGNGAGEGNPGADVGYKGYYSETGASTPAYGTGETHIKIYGGTIKNVYGGSNTLGYIRTHAYVEVLETPADGCDLHLGEVHAGGNEAEMYCGGSVTLACSEGADVVYAGSSDADIHGNIDLVITSGTYGKVFGGNNHSGNVYGGIKINIDETGCWPVMIGELYACGNEAPYSVYGYYNDDDDDVNDDNRGKPRTSGSNKYADPVINLISFTRIGKVFGGGYAAAVYGSPVINVEPIPGIYATGESKPNYVLDGSDERIENKGNSSVANALGADKIGSIGTIYGGGNAGAVYGNTNVKIGTKTTNKHVSGSDKTTEHEVAVTITGNVFGGGNEAIVSGDTNVKIGENN